MPLEALMNPSVSSQLQQALALLQRHLGGNLLAVHLFGSAVVGGLKPGSDLDLLVTVAAPLPTATRHSLMRELLMISAWPANERMRPLEVTWVVHHSVRPWRYPAMRELQFGEWLRADIEAGRIEPPQEDHDLAILLHQAQERRLSDRPWRGRIVRPGARRGHAPSFARHAGAMARARRLAGRRMQRGVGRGAHLAHPDHGRHRAEGRRSDLAARASAG